MTLGSSPPGSGGLWWQPMLRSNTAAAHDKTALMDQYGTRSPEKVASMGAPGTKVATWNVISPEAVT